MRLIALFTCVFFTLPAGAEPDGTTAGMIGNAPPPPEAPQPPLHSREALNAWLRANAGRPTPLDTLSVGGRARFLAGLDFGERGLRTASPEDLVWELDREQARAVLALFGAQAYADSFEFRNTPSRWIGSKTQPSDIDRRYTRYRQRSYDLRAEDPLTRAHQLGTLYQTQFGGHQVEQAETLSDPDLAILTRAAVIAAQEVRTGTQTHDAQALLPLLQARGLDITPLARSAQTALLQSGQIEQARAFAADYPDLDFEPIPRITTAPEALRAGPRWWSLAADGSSMKAEAVDLSDTQILVLAGCHFSIEAAEDIQSDPELGPIFARHARWLAQPLGDESIHAWREWNRKFPDAPIHLITRLSDWPMFPNWPMPTYAVVRKGKVIDQTTGAWRNDPEARTALMEMLRRHDLMPPADRKPKAMTTR